MAINIIPPKIIKSYAAFLAVRAFRTGKSKRCFICPPISPFKSGFINCNFVSFYPVFNIYIFIFAIPAITCRKLNRVGKN